MTNITNEELTEICQFIITYPPPFYQMQNIFVCDLYTTGCRPQELLEIERWSESIIDTSYFTLQPEKGNNTREILKAQVSSNLNFAIVNQIPPYNGLSLRQLEYSMKQIYPCGRMWKETKEMVSYIFRYNRVKEYIAAGKTNSELQTIFGWLNPPIPWDYNSAVLSVEFYNIPAELFYIANSNADTIVDSDGTYISSQ